MGGGDCNNEYELYNVARAREVNKGQLTFERAKMFDLKRKP